MGHFSNFFLHNWIFFNFFRSASLEKNKIKIKNEKNLGQCQTVTDRGSAAAQQRAPTALPTCELSRVGAHGRHGRLGSPEFPPSFDFGAAMELLRRGASTRAIVPHAAYGPDGVGFGGVARLCVDRATGATLQPLPLTFA